MALTDLGVGLGWLFAMGRAGANEGAAAVAGGRRRRGWVVVLVYRFSLSRNKKIVLGVSHGAKMEEKETARPVIAYY